MKYTILLFMFLGILMTVSAQNTQNTEWKTYLDGIRVDYIAVTDNFLWLISDFNTRVIKFDKNSGQVEYYDHKDFNIEPDDWFTDVVCDNDGIPWVGTFVGAFKMSDDKSWNLLRSGGTWAMTKSKDGIVWIAYQYDLIRYEGDNIEIFDGNEARNISSLATDSKSDLWSTRNYALGGFLEDLSKYDGNSWNNFIPPFILHFGSNLNIDENGTKWISANGGSLISYDETTWRKYDTPFQTRINSVAIENENVWCGTMGGLMQFNDSLWTVYYNLNSALPSDTVYTIAIDSDGTKWIGTAKGLAAFNENGLKTSVRHDQKFLDETVLYPNPAHDFITLKIQKQLQNPIVDIININGQLIHSCRIQNNQNRLDISALSSGVYMVRIQSDENHFIKKFVKQ